MSTTPFRHLRIGLAVCSAWAGVLAAHADNQHDYPESGMVISATVDQGYVYTIETGDKVYQMVCAAGMFTHVNSRPCTMAGRPIVVNDTVHFRVDGDTARMPGGEDAEEKFILLATELKILPPVPVSTVAVGDCGVVLGTGVQMHDAPASGNLQAPLHIPPRPPSPPPPSAASTTASGTNPVIPTAPVTAIPVTGGPPVLVMPSAPSTGGVVTGVPVTGGRPVTAIPTGPVTGVPIGAASAAPASSAPAPSPVSSSGPASVGPEWIHFLRVQTDGRVYDLGCIKTCSLKDRAIQLGDVVAIRIEKTFAYLSWPTPGTDSERKFEILDVRGIDDPSPVPPHWVDRGGKVSPLRVREQRGSDFLF